MKSPSTIFQLSVLTGAALCMSACSGMQVTHVPPGQSLRVATAQKAQLVQLPPSATPTAAAGPAGASVVPAVEPPLPDNKVEQVAEAYSRGQFCLSAGKDDEAQSAFEEAVKIDPTFTEAWQDLALIYERKGDKKKAIDAYRQAKKFAANTHPAAL